LYDSASISARNRRFEGLFALKKPALRIVDCTVVVIEFHGSPHPKKQLIIYGKHVFHGGSANLNCNSARYYRVFYGSGQLGRGKTLGKFSRSLRQSSVISTNWIFNWNYSRFTVLNRFSRLRGLKKKKKTNK
jgi:hypothetical protein